MRQAPAAGSSAAAPLRRPLAVLTALLALALLAGCASSTAPGPRARAGASVDPSHPGASSRASALAGSAASAGATALRARALQAAATPTATPPPQLPRGGRTILPRYRVVAYYGNGQSKALGVLGHTPPDESAERLERAARAFATPDRPVLPAFELIVTVAHASPGRDGTYSSPTSDAIIGRWLAAARRHRMLLVLDIQPGRSTFLPAVKHYAKWLAQPDVGLALDPEWRMSQGGAPGSRIGSVDASEINAVSAYLAGIVAARDLPQKLFVVHQFTAAMIRHRDRLIARPGLATLIHLDGFGTPAQKLAKLKALRPRRPFFTGFKLFYRQDTHLLSPAQVLALRPPVDYVSYQ